MPRACSTATSIPSSTNTFSRKLLERSSRRCVTLPQPLALTGPPDAPVEKLVQETDFIQQTAAATAVVERPPVQERTLTSAGSMIVFESVTKVYEPDVVALNDVSFHIDKGEFVFIVGASGSGKSTLIRLLLKELEPTKGKIVVGGRDLTRLKRSKVPMLRRNVGCVFQDFKLLPR